MKFVEDIRATYKFYRDRAFLKKHGCETWQEYNRKFDPDYNPRASRIQDYYHGYPYVYCFENYQHDIYFWDVYRDGTFVISKWCEKNLQGKFRFDGHRVHKQTPIGINGSEDSEWFINEIGGKDYIFGAFQNEQDYLHFMLRWA